MTTHDLINIFIWATVAFWSAFLINDWRMLMQSQRDEFERFKASLQEDRRIARIEAEREIHLSKAID